MEGQRFVVVLAFVIVCCGLVPATAAPLAHPEWPVWYETLVSDFRSLVAASHRYDRARGRLERIRHEGGRCDPCQQEMAAASNERDRLSGRLRESIEHFLVQREQVLGHLDRIARELRTAGESPAPEELEDLFRSIHHYRRLLEKHQALGDSFRKLLEPAETLEWQLRQRPKRPHRIDAGTAESLDRAVVVLKIVAKEAFQNVQFCRDWTETMDRGAASPSDLEELNTALNSDILVQTLGRSTDRLTSLPVAFERQQLSAARGVTLETRFERSRGKIYRAEVEVSRQPEEDPTLAQERAKGEAVVELQNTIDRTITRLDGRPGGIKIWKATLFQGLDQQAKLMGDGRVRGSAEVAESDVFPLIQVPDLESLRLAAE